jgi:hypothetical protein
MTLTPAVPGAINITDLQGDEVVSLQSGAGSTQTTTQDIANLAGGGGTTGPTGPTGSGATGATGPTGSGGGGSGAVLSTGKISLTSAQLLALHSSPVPIIAAPGAGKMILVLSALYELIYGSAAYECSDQTQGLFFGTGVSGNAADSASDDTLGYQVFTAPADTVVVSAPLINTQIAPVAPTSGAENQPVVLSSYVADMTTGDGTGSITVLYTVVTL